MNNTYTFKFRDHLIQLHSDTLETYSEIDWHLVDNLVDEITGNLYLLPDDTRRIAYLRTIFSNISDQGLEAWFDDLSKKLTYKGDKLHFIDPAYNPGDPLPQISPKVKAATKFIKWRKDVCFQLSKVCIKVYPGIRFSEVLKDLGLAEGLFWMENGNQSEDLSYEVDQAKSGLNLKSQFKDPEKYEQVISILIDNGNLRKDVKGNLIFVGGHRAGTKYGAESLRMAFNDLGYLKKQSVLTGPQILEIHRNTFKDFYPSEKTINPSDKKGYNASLGYFLAVLNKN